MAIVNLENGARIMTFAPPPPNFDPLTASAADRARYGFPCPQDDPALLARYQSVFSRLKGKLQVVQPTFRLDPTKRSQIQSGKGVAGTETSGNWSGGVVYAPSGQSFQWVEGDWVVPDVYPPTQGQWYYCANWIGIDGDGGSGDVCQAGMICSVYQSGSSTQRTIYPWHEWAPSGWVEITNLLISPGDMITMMVKTTGGAGSTSATISFANTTSGLATSYTITAPGTTKLVGNCAEWIVETPIVGGVLTQMPDYGEVFFSN